MLEAKAPLSIDNFDACGYIFLNHAHPDHYLNIKEFVDKFHPPISVDSLYAAELSRTIGHAVGMSENTVRKCIRRLEER